MKERVSDTAGRALAVVLSVATLYVGLTLHTQTHTYFAGGTAAVVAWNCGPGLELVHEPNAYWIGAYKEQCK